MNRYNLGSYDVEINIESKEKQFAQLNPASKEDLPRERTKKNPAGWDMNWCYLWERTDFSLEDIIKLVCNKQVFGLVRYALYQVPGQNNPEIYFWEIQQLEANPVSRGRGQIRLIKPIGKWLIWYCLKVALEYGHQYNNKPLVVLSSYPQAVDYYRDVIGMEFRGIDSSAPGEDLYGFSFKREQAQEFIQRQERGCGQPIYRSN